MKKLSLEMLRLTSDEVLQRSQMKKITGGYGSGGHYSCKCKAPAIGQWSHYYSSQSVANGSLLTNCSNQQGNCSIYYRA